MLEIGGQLNPRMVCTLPPRMENGDGEGRLFGEIAAINRIPRTATVLADNDNTKILEISRQGLLEIRKYSPSWREMIDRNFRSHSLMSYLRQSDYTKNMYQKSTEN